MMIGKDKKSLAALAVGGLFVAALAGANAAGASDHLSLTGVVDANPKAPGLSSPNRLSPEVAHVRRRSEDPAKPFSGVDDSCVGSVMEELREC
jgi:hypothetical protein